MQVRVRFRFNRDSGEVEEFLVEDQDSRLSPAEHHRQHDHMAASLGRLLQRHPQVNMLSEQLTAAHDAETGQTSSDTEPDAEQAATARLPEDIPPG